MRKSIIATGLLSLYMLFSVSANGQDLMARQAKMDKQLRAVDSVSLELTREREATYTVNNIYSSWSHDYVDCYANDPKPAFLKIDLRGFTMPTPSRTINSEFGYRRSFRRNHYGIDVKVYTGDTIVSAFSGKVRIVSYNRGGYGYYVVIRHENGLETVYGHLSKQLVHEDQYIRSGEPIGLGGSTGHSTGPHLHFETRVLGEPIDPALLFDFANQDVTGDSYMYYNHNYRPSFKPIEMASESAIKDEVITSTNPSLTEVANADDDVAPISAAPRYHKVKKGDNLYSIARTNNLTVNQLCNLNGLKTNVKLRIGQILKCQ